MNTELIVHLRRAAADASVEAGYDDDWPEMIGQFGECLDDAGVIACIVRAGHFGNLSLNLSAAADELGRTCETCRHRGDSGDGPVCWHMDMIEYGRRALLCSAVGNVCGKWEAR